MPESDAVFPILAAILDIVPSSRWSFAQLDARGELDAVYGSDVKADAPRRLADEYARQRSKAAAGSRIAATLGSLDDFASGITLVFADAHANFGILVLLRTAELGPFTSTEISMLTLALDAFSDRLSELRLHSRRERGVPASRAVRPDEPHAVEGEFYVLDDDFQIVLAWNSDDQRRIALTGLHTRIAERLPKMLEETVRQLTVAWSGQAVKASGEARPVPFLVVRTRPMSGPAGLFIGVRIDRFAPPSALGGAASRFHISPREVQVLALLLDGKHLDQIADQLHITSSTVQDHIKSMLDKTESRNRSELIGRVLGWESTPDAREA